MKIQFILPLRIKKKNEKDIRKYENSKIRILKEIKGNDSDYDEGCTWEIEIYLGEFFQELSREGDHL